MALAIRFLLISLLSFATQAATNYVRADAAGTQTGADWSNAYTNLPAPMTRGDTYYIADGNYASYPTSTSASGTTRVYVYKATVANHGTSTGWDDTYGDGTATFTSLDTNPALFVGSYYTVDGQTGGGPSAWTNNFGFKFISTNGPVVTIGGIDSITQHFEGVGGGDNGSGGATHNDILNVRGVTGALVSYFYIHDAGRGLILCNQSAATNAVFEYGWYGGYESDAGEHAEIASLDNNPNAFTWRYSIFTHCEGTGGIMMSGRDHKIYGNVFVKLPGGQFTGGNGVVGTWSAESITNVLVANNAFIDSDVRIIGLLDLGDTMTFVNNTVYSSPMSTTYGGTTFLKNAYYDVSDIPASDTTSDSGSGDPFVDYPNLDFSLISNTSIGSDLGSPFNTDMNGNTRTTWTRSALEWETGGGSAPEISVQPSNYVISSGETATLSVTATGDAPLTYQWYSGVSGNTSTPIGGATNSSYTTPDLTTTMTYWVRVTNGSGSADSTTATVTVLPPLRGFLKRWH